MLNKKLNDLSEAELLSVFYKKKDMKALGILLNNYLPHVFALCQFYLKNRTKAKDASADILEKMILYFQKHEVSSAKALIMISAKNHCLSLLKRQVQMKNLEEVNELASREIEMDKVIQKDSTLNQLQQSLQELKQEQKNNLTAFYFKKKSYREISIETGQSVAKIKSSIQNGKRMLRQLMLKKMENGNK